MLNKHVEYFIKRKFYEDEKWKNIKVIFSGGNVPGEGEHKILDHIRAWKTSEDFDINDVHCIYGNDSDLVMLSLLMHLPNFFLLREQLGDYKRKIINKATKRTNKPQLMEVLFINLLREYLELEFQDVLKN